MASRYCLISLPLQDSVSNTWSLLQQSMKNVAFDVFPYKFHIPELRVGTLDSLLTLSDDLSKANAVVEGISHKIRRQIEELERASGHEFPSLSVDGVPVDAYMTKFSWDEAKYPVMSPLREVVDTIHETVVKLEDDLKVRVAEYNNVKSQLTAINRKQTGSMAVRDLSNLLQADDIVASEHLTTLLVIVGKYSQKEWLSSYEGVSNFVVPRSSKKIYEDNEYALYTVVLFKRVADTFKTAVRDKGYQVRDYEFDPENKQQREEELNQLSKDQVELRDSLQQWCKASYGECILPFQPSHRLEPFLEECMGLQFVDAYLCCSDIYREHFEIRAPPAFLAAVLPFNPKNEKKIRYVLETLSSKGNTSSFWKADEDSAGMAGLTGGETEVHPYVSFTVNIGA